MPAGGPRALAALGLALTVATCRDALGPRSTILGRVAVAPVFPSEEALGEFGLTIDAVRFIVVRPPADTIADTTLAFPPEATELALDLRVPLVAASETLSVSVVALGGTIPLFAGTSLVPVPSRLPPTVIPVDTYVGPVADSIAIQPRSPFILVNDALRFQVQGFNSGGTPVTQFYVAWSTSDAGVAAINTFGVLRAPASRGSVRVLARTPSGASDSVTATFTLPATQLVPVAGGGQVDTVGDTLVTPLEVRALAVDGIGVGGISVRFRPLAGGGTVVDTLVVTDSAGRARTTARLGGAIGIQTFEASAAGLSGSPVTFGATALAGPVAQLLAAAGDGQLATVNTAVATAPRVQVKDGGGNPVAGVTVTFAVTTGGGSVTGGIDTTDASGLATVGSWTLDTLAGTNTLRATVAGLTRTFTATGVAGTAARLVATAGDLQSAVVGNAVAIDPAVRAEDQFGNPVAGTSITFAVSGGGGGGSVSGRAQLTNAAGVATVGGWTLDTIAATNALTATTGTLSLGFTATGVPEAPSRLVKVLGDSQTAVVNTVVPVTPTVRLSDRYGNPIAGDTVDFSLFTDGGFVASPTSVTDTGGLASAGAWTLANFVTQNTLQASVRGVPSLLPIGFTATGIPDAPAQLLRVSVDTQTTIAGQAVSVPPAVQVVDQFFNPVPGFTVTFSLAGALIGSLTPDAAATDSSGVARVTTWTLATIAGPNTLDAAAPGLVGSPITFSANGITTTATNMALDAGDGQSGIVATLLPTAYSVVVRDSAGLPVPNVQVHWAVDPAGGSMSPSTSPTDVNGIAASTRTLGVAAGTQTATASVGGLAGSPVIFTATALAGAPVRLVKQSVDLQTSTVATAVTAPVVKVTDQFGNGVAAVIVDFAVTAGGGILGATKDTSDGLGLTTAGAWTLGSVAGTNGVTATSGLLPAVGFTATGVADAPARLAFLTEPTHALAGDTIDSPVQVVVQDQFGNTVFPATDVVTMGLGALPDPAAKLLGTVDAAASRGVAVFSNLAIDSAEIGYTLVATAGNLAGAESNRFDVGGVIAAFTGERLDPVAAAFNPVNGLVYVPGVENTLGVLDPSKEQLSVLPILQSQPFGVAVNATTNRVYVTTSMLLVGAVVVIDAGDNAPIATIPLEGEARGIAIDEATDRIFVAVAGDSVKLTPPTLAVIDGKDNGVLINIPFKDGALEGVGVAFNPNDRLVYVAIPNLGVGIFDPEAGVHVTTVPIVSEKGAAGTYGVAVDVRSNLIYATNRTEGTVSLVDPTKLEEISRLPVGPQPEGLGVDAERGVVYVGNSGDNTVSLIDGGKFSVFATLIVGPTPKAAAVDAATGRVYVPTFGDDRVRVILP